MKALRKLRAAAALVLFSSAAAACTDASAAAPQMTVYATPTCGCCKAWVEHMKESGFTVQVVYQDDLSAIKAKHNVPEELMSCHLGVVENYAFEGHVPADVVKRVLLERPAILGVAVPGMPMGAPGMEMPNGHVQPYEVFSFDESGPKAVYEYKN